MGSHLFELVAIGAGITFLVAAVVYSLIPVKSDLAKRLEKAEQLTWDGKTSRSDAFGKIFNAKQRGNVRRQLDEAGLYSVTPAKLVVQGVAAAVFGIAAIAGFVFYLQIDSIWYAGVVPAAVLFGYLPFSRLQQAGKKRKNEIQRALPDFLDMLASTVSAGLAFNAALVTSKDIARGPLGEEIAAALSEIRLGRSRADALKSMADRVHQDQLSSVVTALVQAERLGSNMSTVLKELAEETRHRRMSRAEELANLMPTKMVLPMALFMLPALFLTIFGGIIAQYLSSQ